MQANKQPRFKAGSNKVPTTYLTPNIFAAEILKPQKFQKCRLVVLLNPSKALYFSDIVGCRKILRVHHVRIIQTNSSDQENQVIFVEPKQTFLLALGQKRPILQFWEVMKLRPENQETLRQWDPPPPSPPPPGIKP